MLRVDGGNLRARWRSDLRTRTASHHDRHYGGRRHDTGDCRNYHHYLRNGDHDYHKHHDDNGHNTPAVIRE